MPINEADIKALENGFKPCQDFINAIGDPTRQHIMVTMLRGDIKGVRVVELAKSSNLSRPALSHHMKILKEAKIVKSHQEGTRVYYTLDPSLEEIDALMDLLRVLRSSLTERGEK